MRKISWTKELSVGIKEIDGQHKQFIDLINKATHIEEGEKKQLIYDMIEYVRIHFSTEERYFQKYKYLGKEEHIQEHINLIQEMLKFQGEFENGSLDWSKFQLFLVEWLEDHLKNMDMKYVSFFKEKGVK